MPTIMVTLPVVAMLLMLSEQQPPNPWAAKARSATLKADAEPTASNLRDALEACWRADDWQTALRLARRAQKEFPDDASLWGPVSRAFWRAGYIAEAERVAERIAPDTDDRVAIRTRITIHLARGEVADADRWAQRLRARGPQTAEDYYQLSAIELARRRSDDLAELLSRTERLIDPGNGYPENYLADSIEGVAAFLRAVGPRPLNEIVEYGTAAMPALVMFGLPSCDVMINGRGPYRMVVDTGGSIMLALDQAIADELGLRSIAPASVRGVAGKQETGQVLVEDLRIGSIVCRRVVARTFDLRTAILNAADGIVGTGIFADGRLTLDFAGAQLSVSASRDEPGPGHRVELRLVGDAKLMCPVTLEDQPAVALLDTGADAVALSPSRLRALFPGRPIREVNVDIGLGIGQGQPTEVALGTGVRLLFAERQFANYSGIALGALDKVLGPVLGMQADVLLGMPTFRKMKTLTVDLPRCALWVEWLEGD